MAVRHLRQYRGTIRAAGINIDRKILPGHVLE